MRVRRSQLRLHGQQFFSQVVRHRSDPLARGIAGVGQLRTQSVELVDDLHPGRVLVQRCLQGGFLDIGASAKFGLGNATMIERIDALVLRNLGFDVLHGLAQALKHRLCSRIRRVVGFVRAVQHFGPYQYWLRSWTERGRWAIRE